MANTVLTLTEKENKAMYEWMRRRQFASTLPDGFMHDVCSEGIENPRAIYREISLRLRRLSEMYMEASRER
jgi:hypothetical protein